MMTVCVSHLFQHKPGKERCQALSHLTADVILIRAFTLSHQQLPVDQVHHHVEGDES